MQSFFYCCQYMMGTRQFLALNFLLVERLRFRRLVLLLVLRLFPLFEGCDFLTIGTRHFTEILHPTFNSPTLHLVVTV